MFSFFLLLGIGLWLAYGTRVDKGFLPDFAKLLDRPQILDGLANWMDGRSYLKGEFRGRKIVILLQHKRGRREGHLVVSMETKAAVTMETHDFTNWPDRGTERALYALEIDHQLRLRHRDRCLKALWQPYRLFVFPGDFEPPKWQSILEAMHAVSGSLERRAA